MRKQCVLDCFFSAHVLEPVNEAHDIIISTIVGGMICLSDMAHE